jgi:hypothetical protein
MVSVLLTYGLTEPWEEGLVRPPGADVWSRLTLLQVMVFLVKF